jgi:hypothetical protein
MLKIVWGGIFREDAPVDEARSHWTDIHGPSACTRRAWLATSRTTSSGDRPARHRRSPRLPGRVFDPMAEEQGHVLACDEISRVGRGPGG